MFARSTDPCCPPVLNHDALGDERTSPTTEYSHRRRSTRFILVERQILRLERRADDRGRYGWSGLFDGHVIHPNRARRSETHAVFESPRVFRHVDDDLARLPGKAAFERAMPASQSRTISWRVD